MSTHPALKGDGHGHYRVQIVGNSGAGKSTLAEELATMLDVPCFHLDELFWKPGWVESSTEELKAQLRASLSESQRGWVVDGNYDSRTRGEMTDVTDIIWLDTPFLLYFPRLIKRTLLRLFGLAPTCAPGCNETIRSVFFSSDSILWWAITHHLVVKRRQSERMRKNGLHVGGKIRRISGWGAELRQWKEDVKAISKID